MSPESLNQRPSLCVDSGLSAKDLEQRIVWAKWKEAGYRGTYKGVTGVGKTRVGAVAAGRAITKNPGERWLITVPTENLRDREWVQELLGCGFKLQMGQITIECIQSAYKRSGEVWDGLILDEIHSSLGPQYRKLLENNTFKRILGLTATIEDDEKLKFLDSFAPIFYKTSWNRAVSSGLVSQYRMFNFGVSLSVPEAKDYADMAELIGRTMTLFDGDLNNAIACLKPDNAYKFAKSAGITFRTVIETARYAMSGIRTRKKILYNAVSKITAVKTISDAFPDRKIIIFSESVEFANKIQEAVGKEKCVLFHSKMGKKARKASLDFFSDIPGSRMSSVKALNAGLNVPECSVAIVASGTSKELDQIQRSGRVMRFEEGKVAIVVNLYVPLTQEERWLESRCGFETEKPFWVSSVSEIVNTVYNNQNEQSKTKHLSQS